MKKIIIYLAVILMMTTACSQKNEYVFAYIGDNPPYIYKGKEDVEGFELELLKAIAKKSDFRYKLVKADLTKLDNIFDDRKVDAVFANDTTKIKGEQATDALSDTSVSIASLGKLGDGIEVLKSQKVGVYKHSEVANFPLKFREKYGYAIKHYDTVDELYEGLIKSDVDFIFDDSRLIKYLIQKNAGIKINYTKKLDIQRVFKVSKRKADLVEKINKGLIELVNTGEYERIVQKYN